MLFSARDAVSRDAAARAADEARREREILLAASWGVLCQSRNRQDALDLLDAVTGLQGDDLRLLLKELAAPLWTLARVKKLVLERGRDGRSFSANRFYAELPPSAWALIGPALQSLRHRRLDSVGTELAENPARKRSLVTLYRLREGL
jgi:hypothetical protein